MLLHKTLSWFNLTCSPFPLQCLTSLLKLQESCRVLKKLSMPHVSIQFYPICYYYLNCIELWCLWIGNGRAKPRPPQSQYFRHSSASVSRADWDAAGFLPLSPPLSPSLSPRVSCSARPATHILMKDKGRNEHTLTHSLTSVGCKEWFKIGKDFIPCLMLHFFTKI